MFCNITESHGDLQPDAACTLCQLTISPYNSKKVGRAKLYHMPGKPRADVYVFCSSPLQYPVDDHTAS